MLQDVARWTTLLRTKLMLPNYYFLELTFEYRHIFHIFNFLYKEGYIYIFFAIYNIKNDYIFKFSSYFGGYG
jgi:hypothetical protein